MSTKGCMGRECKEDRHAGDGTSTHKLLDSAEMEMVKVGWALM